MTWSRSTVDQRRPARRDRALARQVRGRIVRVCSYPSAIHIEVHDHVAVVEGPVLAAEHEPVVVAAANVPGVVSVRDRLEPHEKAGTAPGLKGRPRRWPDRERRYRAAATSLVLLLLGVGLTWGASRARRSCG